MDLKTITLQAAKSGQHYAAVAKLMSSQETEPTTPTSLADWIGKRGERGIRMYVALNNEGEVLGFHCLYRDNLNLEGHYGLYLIVNEEFRKQGLGNYLYEHLLTQAGEMDARVLRVRVRDTCDEGIRFAMKRGFVQSQHNIEMRLDLRTWDDQPMETILEALQSEGFRFTNMAELGDIEEARRRLYALNNKAAATDPGSAGIPPWATFEEFELDVCESKWYRPEWQIIAIDARTDEWAAMSAITVFEGADHAYNLFTGTDMRYRGRKLAQAVKTLALRKARSFGVSTVHTSHTSENSTMIAIDKKLGYQLRPGTLVMTKELKA